MKIKNLLLSVLAVTLLGACTNEIQYVPKVGGAVDTLHNEVQVANLQALKDALVSGKLIVDGKEVAIEAGKTYITVDDGFKYTYNPNVYNSETGKYGVFELAEQTDTIINFYFDAAQTTRFVDSDVFMDQVDAPIYSLRWYKLKPILSFGMNEEIVANLNDQDYVESIGAVYGFHKQEGTHLIGWSLYPTCLGDYEHLWNFSKDYKQQAITALYGVWVED